MSAEHELREGGRAPRGSTRRPSEAQLAVVAFVVAMLAFLVHRTAAGAVGPGDEELVLGNELVQDAGVASARTLVAESFAPPALRGANRPLALLSLQLDSALGGGPRRLSIYRRTSVALHALNAGLLVVLLAFLFGNVWAAGAAGLAFALHPLTVEPVLWLSERGTLLGTFFVLVSSIAYVRRAQRSPRSARHLWLAAALVAYGLALLANPAFVALPVVLLVFDAWPLRRFGPRAVLEKLPWFALGAGAVFATGMARGMARGTDPSRLLQGFAHQAQQLAWPARLSIVYPPDGVGLDSFAYLPLVAIALVLAGVLTAGLRPGRAAAVRYVFAALVTAGFALPLAFATRGQQQHWTTSEALFRHAVLVAPDAPAAHALLAVALARAGQPDEAVRSYQDAIARDPFYPDAWHALGDLLFERGDLDGALEAYENATGLFPENAVFATSRALAVERSGDHEAALVLFRLAVELDPDDAAARHELGLRLLLAGSDDEAGEHLVVAVRRRPRWVQARASYARLLIANERWEEARIELEAGLALDAGDHELHNNLAVVLAELGDEAGALAHAEATVRLRADLADVQHNHGNALARAGKREAALEAYERALAIDPELLPTVVNRALLLKEMGRLDEALEGLERAVELAPDNEELRRMLERLRGR